MSAPALGIHDLRFAYPSSDFELRLDSLVLERGRKLACIGPSGCGKTTLTQLISGILLPSGGWVRIAGREISSANDAQRRDLRIEEIGMMFQELALLDHLDGLDNILLPFHVSRSLTLDRDARDRARSLARELGIERHLSRSPSHLSGGERQRLALCRALVTRPSLLICDEPTGNLDPESTHSTLDLLFEQVESKNATLFLVTHDHTLLERFDEVLDLGTLRRAGS